MSSQEPMSRSGMIARADIPNDVLTVWVRRGLVRPIYAPAGTGRHLRFEWYEANIAAVMSQLRQFGMSVDGMLSVAATFREAITWAASYDLDRDAVFALWSVFNIYADYRRDQDDEELERSLQSMSCKSVHGAQGVTDQIRTIHAAMPEEEFRRHLDPFLSITQQPTADDLDRSGDPDTDWGDEGELTYIWKSAEADAYRFAWGRQAPQMARKSGALAMIAIDISAVLYGVWNRPENEAQ